MNRHRILVVEDDPAIRRGISASLRFNGYELAEAEDGTTGLAMALAEAYDLLLLDLNLPGCDGLEILRQLRAQSPSIPVIVLTARGDEGDRVKGLKLGADDYVVKPFGPQELLARIEAVLRRSPARPREAPQVSIPGGVIDLGRREVRFDDGTQAAFSERETELLALLTAHAGQPISRNDILARVWHLNPEAVETRTVDMTIARLRERLRDDGAQPKLILTVRGRGYQFAGTPS
jgi:DNA-binding response OmpR family regulator